jgi:hypothetical protein
LAGFASNTFARQAFWRVVKREGRETGSLLLPLRCDGKGPGPLRWPGLLQFSYATGLGGHPRVLACRTLRAVNHRLVNRVNVFAAVGRPRETLALTAVGLPRLTRLWPLFLSRDSFWPSVLTSVVVVDLGVGVLRGELIRGQEEHVFAVFASSSYATLVSPLPRTERTRATTHAATDPRGP